MKIPFRLAQLSALVLILAVGCSASGNSTGTQVQILTIDEFSEILGTRSEEYTVINVHIPYEGEVEGTDAHVPYNNMDALTAALPDKDAPIILYCRSGRMSDEASKALVELGYTQVWDVPGGMIAWEQSGLPLK